MPSQSNKEDFARRFPQLHYNHSVSRPFSFPPASICPGLRRTGALPSLCLRSAFASLPPLSLPPTPILARWRVASPLIGRRREKYRQRAFSCASRPLPPTELDYAS